MSFHPSPPRPVTPWAVLAALSAAATLLAHSAVFAADSVPARETYLAGLAELLRVDWPKNRTINIVCHGHSVPAGYFETPEVRSAEAYPALLRAELARRYPHAVINVIVTAIGGETSVQGAARFEKDVLCHQPDLILIDYALNDRRAGLPAARDAWAAMIEQAQARGIRVLLLTPTPDLTANLDDPSDPLLQHAAQIRQLAAQYQVGLVDSLAAFRKFTAEGGDLPTLMAQKITPMPAVTGWWPTRWPSGFLKLAVLASRLRALSFSRPARPSVYCQTTSDQFPPELSTPSAAG